MESSDFSEAKVGVWPDLKVECEDESEEGKEKGVMKRAELLFMLERHNMNPARDHVSVAVTASTLSMIGSRLGRRRGDVGLSWAELPFDAREGSDDVTVRVLLMNHTNLV